MTEPRQAWEQVGSNLSGLGVKLKQHLDQDLNDDDEEVVASALKRLGDAIEETMEAIGNAAKDPAVKEDVKTFGKSFLEALSVTVETAGEKVKEAVEKRRAADGGTTPPPPDSGTTPPPPDGGATPPPPDAGAAADAATSPPPAAEDGPVPPTPAVDDEPQIDDGLED